MYTLISTKTVSFAQYMREELIGYLVLSHFFVIKMVIGRGGRWERVVIVLGGWRGGVVGRVGVVRVVNGGESEATGRAGVRLAQG